MNIAHVIQWFTRWKYLFSTARWTNSTSTIDPNKPKKSYSGETRKLCGSSGNTAWSKCVRRCSNQIWLRLMSWWVPWKTCAAATFSIVKAWRFWRLEGCILNPYIELLRIHLYIYIYIHIYVYIYMWYIYIYIYIYTYSHVFTCLSIYLFVMHWCIYLMWYCLISMYGYM